MARRQVEVAFCDFPECGQQREQMTTVQMTRTDRSVVEMDLCPEHWQALMSAARPAGQFQPLVTELPMAGQRRLRGVPRQGDGGAKAWAAGHGVRLQRAVPADVAALYSRHLSGDEGAAGRLKAWAADRDGKRAAAARAQKIRAWARGAGIAVEAGGRLPAEVTAAYDAAMSAAGQADGARMAAAAFGRAFGHDGPGEGGGDGPGDDGDRAGLAAPVKFSAVPAS